VLVNLQNSYTFPDAQLSALVRKLKQRLRLENKEFNICLVDDRVIRRLNFAYRGKDKATDVLSFPWYTMGTPPGSRTRLPSARRAWGEGANFLGEVVISVETARRNARAEGHSTLNEIRWLIVHGVLHLLGYDHERDTGEMVALELSLREQLDIAGPVDVQNKAKKSQNAKVKR